MKGRSKKRYIKFFLIGMIILIIFSPFYMYFSHDVAKLKTQYPHLKVTKEKGEYRVQVEIKPKVPSHWVNLKNISRYGKWAIILSEDWAFYQHQGIDFEQLKLAFSEMMDAKRVRGASTITQQMVKNIFLNDSRTLWRKAHEMILAQKTERALSKDQILAIYLNSIEYGPGIYGIKNAARHYFNKSPAYLGPKEAAFLAMLLPAPKKYDISFRKRQLTPFARKRIKAILTKLRMAKIIGPHEYDEEMNRPLSWER